MPQKTWKKDLQHLGYGKNKSLWPEYSPLTVLEAEFLAVDPPAPWGLINRKPYISIS